ncbi:unnamed protein product [Lupinus luteus]|uniref:Uncharacterized protein n=1 Tax=Lupinus luteus TaxID=3873 RepID=A0AAV1XQJ9_LUPLU
MASQTIFNSESDEDNWVIQINQLVSETNLTILSKIPVCIYQVPKSLSCVMPEAFTPQLIAIGPYNHFCPELYPMERFKVCSAKRVLDYFNKHDFKHLVEQLHNTAPYIRACYHKYLDLKDDTLLYTIAIDALFLIELYHNYLDVKVSSSFLAGLEQAQMSGVKTKNAIIRDMIMVENQIPTYMLMRILSIGSSKPVDSVEEELGSMLLSFCDKHCPFKLTNKPITCSEAVSKYYHILDLMYHMAVSQQEKPDIVTLEIEDVTSSIEAGNYKRSSSENEDEDTMLKKVKDPIIWILGFLKKLKDMQIPRPIKRHIDAIVNISSIDYGSSETSPSKEKAPVVITIPSVCELHSVGIRFEPSQDGIIAIEFDEKKGIFYLPLIKLDVNSEVIMRNLVAHEALTKPNFLIFTKYTELMREIIDSEKDVKILKESNIIKSNSSLGIKEIEQLFNGMSKSIGPTKTKELDGTINKVTKYYHEKRKANLYRNFTEYVYSSWKFFTLLSTFVLLAMTAIQTVCTAYDCSKVLKRT